MSAYEVVSFLLAAYLAAAVILAVCAVMSWFSENARWRDGGA
jgi:hypothetical protein